MSYLIIGGTKEERQQKARQITNSQFLISNFDTFLVEGETSIGIDEIRGLEHNLNLKPYSSPYQAAIIHPGELLTIEAQNAFLKLLEEPSESSIIILTAPQIETLLPTVVSRCQIIKLPSKLEIELDEKSLTAYSLLLTTILKAGVGERLKIASGLGKQREEISHWLEKLVYFLREILLCKTELNLTAGQIVKIIRSLEKTKAMVEQNINPRLALEIFLLDLPKV